MNTRLISQLFRPLIFGGLLLSVIATASAQLIKPVSSTAAAKPMRFAGNRTYQSYHLSGNELHVRVSDGEISFRPFTTGIVECSWIGSEALQQDTSYAVILKPEAVTVFVDESSDRLIFDLHEIQVLVEKNPFRISYLRNGSPVLDEEQGFYQRPGQRGIRFSLAEKEMIYGTGERANAMNLRGSVYELYNRPHYGYEIGAKNLNYSLPVFVSSRKYMVLVDNPQKANFDIDSKGDGVLDFGAIGGPLRYYLVVAEDFPKLLERYGKLTGTQPLPPRWALGNLQSRMAYRTQAETTAIVDSMIARDFPIDAIIIDYNWFGDSILGHVGRLDWFRKSWPDPEGMIAGFKQKGVKTILITEPYIIDTLENFRTASARNILATDSLGKTYVNRQFYFGDAGLIDIFKPEAGQWFWSKYVAQIDKGVAGWWGDLGEPESHPSDIRHVLGKADQVHNIYAHYWHRMLFDNYRKYYPQTRLFNLNRSGYAGSQRYAIFPWTGDVSRSWGGLQAQLPAMLHMSLSGIPYIHADAGGFAMGVKDEELYRRWLQFAVFSPILRPHGSGIPSEPIFFNDTTQSVVRRFMKLRYELMPYLYNMGWEATVKGQPLIRPLFYYYPEDKRFEAYDGGYFFGSSLLVYPVVQQGQLRMDVPLPRGTWYDFWTGERVRGGATRAITTTLETIPVFVKAGSVIPRVPAVNTTDTYSSRKLFLHCYLHETEGLISGQMYEDDGHSPHALEKNAYELMLFNGIQKPDVIQLGLLRLGDGYAGMPESRQVEVILYGLNRAPVKADLSNMPLNALLPAEIDSFKQGYWLDESGNCHFRILWAGNPTTLTIH